MTLQALRAELDADPLARGYAGMTDAQAAASLNTADRPVDRTDVPGHEIYAAITPTHALQVYDLATGTPAHQRWLDIMFQLDSVPLDNANIRTALTTIFAGKQSTLDALVALQTVTVSRAQELSLGRVLVGDVTQARALA